MQFLKFWWEAIWASLSFGWVVFGIVSTAMPALFALLVRYWTAAANVTWIKWSADHQTELHVGIAALFVVVYLVYAPYRLYSREYTARIAAEQNRPTESPAPIKFDVIDTEVRSELQKTKAELGTTKKDLEKAQATIRALDPMQQPIASMAVDATVIISSSQQFNNHFMDAGGLVGFCRGSEPLLVIRTGDSVFKTVANQQVAVHADFNSPISGPMVGKIIPELGTSEYLQIEFQQLPHDVPVLRGKIVVTLNGTQRFAFDVPAQTANGNQIFVRDLFPLMTKLHANQP